MCGTDLNNCDATQDTSTAADLIECFAFCDAASNVFQCGYDSSSQTCYRFYTGGITGNVYYSPGVTLYYKDGLSNPGPSFTVGSCGGSCPDVYAFDGSTYQFETDMGLYGNMAIPRGDGSLLQGFDYDVLAPAVAGTTSSSRSHHHHQ